MSGTWTGSSLLTYGTGKYGLTDTTSQARFLTWMNEIQNDICDSYAWPFLKFKMKKQIISGDQEIDLAPQIPSACTIALLAGGSITTASACLVKITFVLFDESGKEYASIESEPSAASNSITVSGGNLSLTLTAIDTYDGTSTVKPSTIHRRIYLSVAGAAYFLSATLTDNTTTTTTITSVPTSTVEPPEFSMVKMMAGEDPTINGSTINLNKCELDDLLKADPGNLSSGIPRYYARVGESRIYLYPKPSATYTLTYWVYRTPSRIFNETTRAIQMHQSLKSAFDMGITWKGYDYRQDSDTLGAFQLYEQLKKSAHKKIGFTGGKFGHVREL